MMTELPWTPALLQQAEDRIHRIGQKNACNVYYLLGQNTIDEDIAKLLDSKAAVTNAVNVGGDTDVSEGILNGLLATMTKGK
jgi:SNF2 family DNA or RNA helicase